MASAESQQRGSRVDVLPVVVRVGDAEVAGVFIRVVVTVPDQGCLPMVMKVGATWM